MTPEVILDQEGMGMRKVSMSIVEKASVSLSTFVGRQARALRPNIATKVAGFDARDPENIDKHDTASVIIELDDPDALEKIGQKLGKNENLERLEDRYWSGEVDAGTINSLIENHNVSRIQGKKLSKPHLTEVFPDIGLAVAPNLGQRIVEEDGQNVMIGVIDSGFDLSHPIFYDTDGNLRVESLLDQEGGNRAYTNQQLVQRWKGGPGPGSDLNGHGTHVASIAGGSDYHGYGGIAPGARFLLVKTNFRDTDRAIKWIFDQAKGRPCVVNMSLGHHFGSHDGTDSEERLHRALTGPGKIIVVSAGNEQNDNIHIGGRFSQGETQEVIFDLKRQISDPPYVAISLWYHEIDEFEITLVSPSGQMIPMPGSGEADMYQTSVLDLEVSTRPYSYSHSVQTQISLGFRSQEVRDRDIENWKLSIKCLKANSGRIDGWFNNSGYAMFRTHKLVESRRTVGISATGDGCLAVASHVTKTKWNSDIGSNEDLVLVSGRNSPFSSLGPTRDDRWKPDISAPGQYITAALADNCELSKLDFRASVADRLLTIEGTSMSAPVITGVVALMLQKSPGLDLVNIKKILQETAKHDIHTGPEMWHPAYGFGKVNIAAALSKLP